MWESADEKTQLSLRRLLSTWSTVFDANVLSPIVHVINGPPPVPTAPYAQYPPPPQYVQQQQPNFAYPQPVQQPIVPQQPVGQYPAPAADVSHQLMSLLQALPGVVQRAATPPPSPPPATRFPLGVLDPARIKVPPTIAA